MRQTFINDTAAAVTADYFFPMSPDVAIFHLEAAITDEPGAAPRIIRAIVREKKQARRAYYRALVAGREAVLMERSEESEDIFKLGVGNVPAGARVVITIAFVTELITTVDDAHPDAAAARLVLPRHLLHRYVPARCLFKGEADVCGAWSVADAVASAGAGAASEPAPPLSVQLAITSAAPLASIASPSHASARGLLEEATGSQHGLFILHMPATQWIDDLHADSHKDLHIVLVAKGEALAAVTSAAGASAGAGAGASSATASVSTSASGAAAPLAVPPAVLVLEEATLPGESGGGSKVHASAAASPASEAAIGGAGAAPSGASFSSSSSPTAACSVGSSMAALDDASCMTVAITITPELAKDVLARNHGSGSSAGFKAPSAAAGVASAASSGALGGQPLPEFVFVLDRSGSMGGARIEAARRALCFALRCLPPNSRFGIIQFDNEFQALMGQQHEAGGSSAASGGAGAGAGAGAAAAAMQSDDSSSADLAGIVDYNDDTLAEATRLIDGIAARGGTEMLRPLLAALSTPSRARNGSCRSVFVFTDGEVANTREIVAVARAAVDAAGGALRIHAFGIGSGVSTAVVQGLADAGAGCAEFITDGEAFEGKVARVLEVAVSSALLQVEVDWGCEAARWAAAPVAGAAAGASASAGAAAGVDADVDVDDGAESGPYADVQPSVAAVAAAVVPGVPAVAQLHAEPVRLFTVLRKLTGPGSTAAALSRATVTIRESGESARSAQVRLLDLPLMVAVHRRRAAAATAGASATTAAARSGSGDATSALALRAVQAAIRELERAEDCNTLTEARNRGLCGPNYDIYSGALTGQLPPSTSADFCRSQATTLSIRWGILARHTALMGEAEAAAADAEDEKCSWEDLSSGFDMVS